MEGKPLRKPQPYWLLPAEARAHIDRICRSMRSKPPDEDPVNLPIQLTAEDIADAERLLEWRRGKEGSS
jgi:hypothetical protein